MVRLTSWFAPSHKLLRLFCPSFLRGKLVCCFSACLPPGQVGLLFFRLPSARQVGLFRPALPVGLFPLTSFSAIYVLLSTETSWSVALPLAFRFTTRSEKLVSRGQPYKLVCCFSACLRFDTLVEQVGLLLPTPPVGLFRLTTCSALYVFFPHGQVGLFFSICYFLQKAETLVGLF